MQLWKALFSLSLLATSLLPAWAQNTKLPAFKATVPHEFKIGNHKFKAGMYELVVVGPGLMLVRDAKGKLLTRLLTRAVPGPQTDMPSHVVFEKQKGPYRLASLWIQNSAGGLEILGEDVAIGQSRPVQPIQPILLPPRSAVPALMPN